MDIEGNFVEKIKENKILKSLFYLIVIVLILSFLLYGPFKFIKETIITTSATTFKQQWIAEIFYSNNDIKKVLNSNKIIMPDENSDESLVNPVDKNIESEVIKIKGKTFEGYLVKVYNPSKVKIAFSKNLGESGEKLYKLIRSNNGFLGINGSGFSDEDGHSAGMNPVYLAMKDKEILYIDPTQSFYNVIGITNRNVLVIGKYTMDELKNSNFKDAISFIPPLIVNGKRTEIIGNGGWGYAPRSAVGQTADGTFLFLTIDGRQLNSIGATMKDLQDIFIEHGAVNAANLDGGSSAIMVKDGKNVNNPCTSRTGRYIPCAFIEIK